VSLILAWVAFPLLLAAVGAGWGVLVELLAGRRVGDALLLPVGLAAVIVVAGTLTAFSGSAPLAVPVAGVGTGAGLLLAWPRLRVGRFSSSGRWPLIGRWAALAALGTLLVYGAPVLLSGKATFTGVIKLDDTSTWLNIVDSVMAHGRSLASLPESTFRLVYEGDVGPSYPLGAFMLLGIGHGLTGIDAAWIFQPYEACCAAGLALCVYALITPLIASQRLRALVAFLAAQPALLYGYSLWGGIKEITGAFLLALGVALTAAAMRQRPRSLREVRGLLPLALAAGALIQTLGIGAGTWVAPALLLLMVAWLWPGLVSARRAGATRRAPLLATGGALAGLVAMTAVFVVPVWIVLGNFLGKGFAGFFSEGQSQAQKFGNLVEPVSGWQLAGIWPTGDFRYGSSAQLFLKAPSLLSALLIILVVVAAAVGVAWAARRREPGVPLYLAVALAGAGIVYFSGATPWVTGKALAVSAPALITAALSGAAMLWSRRSAHADALPALAGNPGPVPAHNPGSTAAVAAAAPHAPGRARGKGRHGRGLRPGARRQGGAGGARAPLAAFGRRYAWALGLLALALLGYGVLWSNFDAYENVTLAPRDRLAELQHIGELVSGKGPTLANFYEVYADRHFLREGAPVEPAEYRPAVASLPLRTGAILTKSAEANLDQFTLAELEHYRSIVTQRAPVESRPPSNYELIWQGRYYQLWQRPEHPTTTILEYIPYGEPNEHPYCGVAQNTGIQTNCVLNPVAIPSCPQLHRFARKAAAEHAHLVAYQRPETIGVPGDEVRWPAGWQHESAGRALAPTSPGTAIGHIAISNPQRFELFLGGSFARGFEVHVDGRKVGTVKNELSLFRVYVPVASLYLPAGVHTFEYTYPAASLAPGGGWNFYTALDAVVLEPLQYPQRELIGVPPAEVSSLCGRPLNWVEIVANS
jgi:hypothetical protein